jgi:hypothetical protein
MLLAKSGDAKSRRPVTTVANNWHASAKADTNYVL